MTTELNLLLAWLRSFAKNKRPIKKAGRLLICIFLLFGVQGYSQLVTNNTLTPTQLVQNVLLGTGVTAFNVTFTGNVVQRGQFNAVNTNLPFAGGVILSSGDIAGAIGPNNQGGATTPIAGVNGPGDPDLDVISGVNTFDAAVLEFDFIPLGDSVKFNYVFASEEYLEFVGGGVNDAFGFILTGISVPFGPTNIARLPNGTVVSINTVNSTSNPAYYINNGTGANAPFNADSSYIQYDGRTVLLTAKERVVCGELYHIKIAIADGGDRVLDSGVFLQENSFSAAVEVTADIDFGSGDSAMFEGCGTAEINFARATCGTQQDTILVQVSGSATPGLDYTPLPDTIFFPPGVRNMTVAINAFADGLSEGTELIHILVTTRNAAGVIDTVELDMFITNIEPLVLNPTDTSSYCPGQQMFIGMEPSGGYGLYEYAWSTSQTTDSIIVSPTVTTTYYLTLSDTCGIASIIDSMEVYVPPPMVANAGSWSGGNDTICLGDSISVGMNGNVVDGYPYMWSNGDSGIVVGGSAAIFVAPTVTTTYRLTLSHPINRCPSDSDDVKITVIQPAVANAGLDKVVCTGSPVTIGGPGNMQNGFRFLWSNGVGNGTVASGMVAKTFVPPASATYTLTVSDPTGHCPDAVDDVLVTVNPLPTFNVSGGGTVCEPNTAPDIVFTMTGSPNFTLTYGISGTGPFSVLSTGTTYNISSPPDGNYTPIGVVDNNGCQGVLLTGSASAKVLAMPTYNITGGGPICDGEPANDVVITFTGNPLWNFTWTDNNGGPPVIGSASSGFYTIPNPVPGLYELLSLSDAQCSGVVEQSNNASVTLEVKPRASLSGGGTYCAGDSLPLTINFTGTGPWMFFFNNNGGAQNPILATTTPFQITTPAEGFYTIYRMYDANCEADTTGLVGEAEVVIHDRPNAFITGGGEICDGEPVPQIRIDFQGTLPFDIQYTIDGVPQVAIMNINDFHYLITTPVDGQYDFTSVTDYNCAATIISGNADVIIHPTPIAAPFAGENNTYCLGTKMDDMVAKPAFGGAIRWYTDGSLTNLVGEGSNMQPLSVIGVTEYFAAEVIGYCAGPSSVITTEILPSPTVNAGPDQRIYEGETVELNAFVNGGTPPYGPPTWVPPFSLDDPLSLNPIASPLETTEYLITITDINCPRTDTVKVVVVGTLEVPTGITPNGDGYNDVWQISNIEDYPNSTVRIFNRWGDVVWLSEVGYPKPWNGTYNGSTLPTGSYFFEIALNDDRTKPLTGTLTILR